MAVGTFKYFGNFFVALANKEIDLNSDSIKVMHTSATPNQDTWDYKDDVTPEVTGTNVPAGGTVCANVTVGYTAGTNVVKIDHDDISIGTATATNIVASVWYDDTPATAATKPLIGFVVWDTPLSPSAGTLAITLDSAGLTTITPAA